LEGFTREFWFGGIIVAEIKYVLKEGEGEGTPDTEPKVVTLVDSVVTGNR